MEIRLICFKEIVGLISLKNEVNFEREAHLHPRKEKSRRRFFLPKVSLISILQEFSSLPGPGRNDPGNASVSVYLILDGRTGSQGQSTLAKLDLSRGGRPGSVVIRRGENSQDRPESLSRLCLSSNSYLVPIVKRLFRHVTPAKAGVQALSTGFPPSRE